MMATIQQTHTPILNSNAQVLILPVNSAGMLLDPVLMRCKSLYADNYQRYHQACRDGSLMAGSCLLHKRQREQAGLSASHNGNQPDYIANLVVSNHPYHPTRSRWLNAALADLQQQLLPLIRYQGVRKVALLARPLLFENPATLSAPSANSVDNKADLTNDKQVTALVNTPNLIALDWQSVVLPLISSHLQPLPKLRVDIHLPKSVAI